LDILRISERVFHEEMLRSALNHWARYGVNEYVFTFWQIIVASFTDTIANCVHCLLWLAQQRLGVGVGRTCVTVCNCTLYTSPRGFTSYTPGFPFVQIPMNCANML
jgi:hypothetical protein